MNLSIASRQKCLNQCTYRNDAVMSETNGSVGAVIILLLNAFEQSAILTVSYVICKACYALFMVAKMNQEVDIPSS